MHQLMVEKTATQLIPVWFLYGTISRHHIHRVGGGSETEEE